MPEYIKNEHGLPIRQYPERTQKRLSAEDRMRQAIRAHRVWQEDAVTNQPLLENPTSTHQARIEYLTQAIRRLSKLQRESPNVNAEDGWY